MKAISTPNRKPYFLFSALLLALLLGLNSVTWAQQLSPTGDGGFETGGTFALNNWVEVQPNILRKWQIGTVAGVQGGTNAAYVGSSTAYNGTGTNTVMHFYRDIVIPAGATNVLLSYYFREPTIDNTYDKFYIFTTTPSYTPVSGTIPGTGYTQQFFNTATAYSAFSLMPTINLSTLAGTTVRLVFTFKSDGASPHANPAIDNISLAYTETPMTFTSCTTTQTNLTTIAPGATSQEIIGMQVVTAGSSSPLTASSFTFTTNGSTSAVDIANAKLWTTGTTGTFATTTQLGDVKVSPSGSFTITGGMNMPYTLASGTNYFWLTYDIVASPTLGDVVDARCNSITVTSARAPTVTNPAGNRTIAVTYCTTGLYTTGCSGGDDINSISMSNLNQSSTGCTGGLNIADYTSTSVNFEQGITYPYTITSNYTNEYTGWWIDFNNNGNFGDAGEFIGSTSSSISGTITGTVTIPSGAAVGSHRMRVRLVYNNSQSLSTSCTTFNYGETHDYTANIVAPCATNPGNPTSNSPQCANTGVTLTRTGTPPSGETWYWQTSETGTSTANSGITYNVATSGTYYIRSQNNSSLCWSPGAGSIAVTVNPLPSSVTITPSIAAICNGSIQPLVASGGVINASTILIQNFDGGIGTFTVTANSSTPEQDWTPRTNGYIYSTYTFSGSTDGFILANSDAGGYLETTNTRLISPSFSTFGFSNISLQFKEYLNNTTDIAAAIEISADDFTTTTVLRNDITNDFGTSSIFASTTIPIPVAFENKASVKIRFRYEGSYDWFWAVDELSIVGTQSVSFTWAPTTSLYTDALAGTPYTGGAATTVYAKPSTTQTYTATATSSTGCSNAGNVTVTVNPAPGAPTATTPQEFCGSGTVAGLSAAPGANGNAIEWYTAATGGTALATTYVLANGVTYYAGSLISGGCSSLTRTPVLVNIYATPTVNAGPDQIKCKDSPVVTLSGSIGGGATTVTWTTSGTGSFNNSNSLTAEYAPSAADIAANSVTLTLTTDNPAGPCIAVSDFMVVSFIAAPTANAGNDGVMCTTSATYAVSGASAANYSAVSWTSSGTGYFTGGGTLTPVYTPSAGDITAGNVTLTLNVTATTPCTNTSDAMILTFRQAANADAGPDDYACISGYTLNGSSVANAASFIWSRPAGTGEFDNPALLHATFMPAVGYSGPVTLTLTATGYSPCSPSVNDIVLTVVNLPAPVAADASAIATGSFTANWPPAVTGAEGYRLDVATDDLFTSYVPGYQNLLVTGNSTTSKNVTGLSQSTYYWYRVRSEGHGCQSGNSDVIQVKTADASITITGVTGAPFDVGCSVTDNGTVTFTYDGSFNVGNNFIAQLSDNLGSFALPVFLGSASASPISILIPANTPTGNGSYQIQVVSSDPSGITSLPSSAFTITNTPCADAYRTKGSGDWSDYTNVWEVNPNGSGWTAAVKSPDYHDGTITIQNEHIVTVKAIVTVDQVTVEAGGTLINAYNPLYAYYLKLANGTGDDLIVNGTMIANDYIENNAGATIKFGANSLYQHNLGGGKKSPVSVNLTTEIPTATWDPTSTCEIQSVFGSTVTGLNQTFGNFIWNYPDVTIDLLGELTDIRGDFTIKNSGGATKLASTPTGHRYLLTVGGKLDIQMGSVLELGDKQNLTVNGNTTLADPQCLVLLSSAYGTASFIDNGNVSGTVLIERYLTPYTIQDPTDFRYHFLSSPVVNQPIQTEFVDLPNTINDFYAWSEGANQWINTKYETEPPYSWNPAFEPNFIQGKGYLVAYQDQQLKSFTGAPFTGSLTMSCTYGTGNGWNLLGNPYPSAVDWNEVLKLKGSGMDDALYYYENFTPRYTYYIPLTGGIGTSVSGGSQYVPAMQGFMVHAKSTGTQTITMNNAARVHDGMEIYYKSSLLTQNVLNIHIDGNDSRDDARVCFYEPATLNFDGEYDAYKLFSYNTTIPELYSITNDNTNLAINTLPLSDMYGSVPLGFLPGTAGSFTFTAEGIENFPSTVYIKLEDKKTGIIQKLNDNPAYAFIASPDDDAKRFVLHFQDATSVNNTDKQDDFSVFNDNGTINIIALKAVSGHVNIIDMAGRKVGMAKLISGTPVRIDMKDHFGVYIVNIITNQGIVNKKVVVN